MQTMTSAYANKMLKSLEEDKAFWVNKEATSSTYVAAINEEPVVPEYDYTEVVATITSLDEKIAIIKHALNVTNSNEKVRVGDAEMSIDTILIKMAQLNKRKSVLDQMRKQLPKAREEQRSYMSRNTVPEYRYINYDLELIKKEYEAVSKTIMEMQMALDKYNQTVQFEPPRIVVTPFPVRYMGQWALHSNPDCAILSEINSAMVSSLLFAISLTSSAEKRYFPFSPAS